MIRNIADFLSALVEEEAEKLSSYELKHCPTIGKMYEGLSADLLSRTFPDGLGMKVVEGFVVGPNGESSGQIDCMLVQGEGERVPFTDSYKWPVWDVIAVFEIKKNLYGKDLLDSFGHLRQVYESFSSWFHGGTNLGHRFRIGMALRAFEQITGLKAPSFSKFTEELSLEHQAIFYSVVIEHVKPLSVVLGYGGYANEKSLREGLIDLLAKQKPGPGWGVPSFPSMISCNGASLLKATGNPYSLPMVGEYWDFFLSTRKNPVHLLLELIWTRIEVLSQVGMPWGDDHSRETLNRFVSAKTTVEERGVGWEYRWDPYTKEMDEPGEGSVPWHPQQVSDLQHATFVQLCQDESIDTSDLRWQTSIEKEGLDITSFIRSMQRTGYVSMDGETMCLSAVALRCADLDGIGKCVGENNDGRFTHFRKTHGI